MTIVWYCTGACRGGIESLSSWNPWTPSNSTRLYVLMVCTSFLLTHIFSQWCLTFDVCIRTFIYSLTLKPKDVRQYATHYFSKLKAENSTSFPSWCAAMGAIWHQQPHSLSAPHTLLMIYDLLLSWWVLFFLLYNIIIRKHGVLHWFIIARWQYNCI